ncbi:chemotaxis response regulator protein-glutamate methylesterase [Paenibacillus antri]|uniref:Protein-glutamate methylesterase/protein-glutamine glutaminase n=1 Tax=Paenibacillus antri TaxID=2582848 RepID=A0A5R9G476_9BACL|nr:chemotaxis response regulator protein-glutamate methylesterase [Paenibacillus antri]TLS49829.1 chemotaxis response regulator protein-glutamate methylesterase [Paenibacillus antri]
MPPYRILVVDDSAFMRKVVSDIVNSDETLTVVGTARNGAEAIEAVKLLRPDAVTMDLEMPVMTGLEALPMLMKEAPTPVIMLSSSTVEGAAATIQALELGAFDFVPKPSGPNTSDLGRLQESLAATLRAAVAFRREETVSRLQPAPLPPPSPPRPKATEPLVRGGVAPPTQPKPTAASKPPARPAAPAPAKPAASASAAPSAKPVGKPAARPKPPVPEAPPPAKQRPKPPNAALNRVVAIGTSTGGPRALQQVLTRLPEHFPAPVLVVQHMPAGFTKSLAQRLNTLCAIEVTEAEDGMELRPGAAYIAPGGLHMTLRKEGGSYRIRLNEDPPRSGHRPSVDALFESLALTPELDRTAVLMTGMGSDGAKGMKALYDQGVRRTIAEDASSCIVYGMPRAAVELGCVAKTVPLESIADQIRKEVEQAEEV